MSNLVQVARLPPYGSEWPELHNTRRQREIDPRHVCYCHAISIVPENIAEMMPSAASGALHVSAPEESTCRLERQDNRNQRDGCVAEVALDQAAPSR